MAVNQFTINGAQVVTNPAIGLEPGVLNNVYPYGDVRRHGATGAAGFDARSAFANADTSAIATYGNNATVRVPAGTHRIASNLSITSGVTLDAGAVIKPDSGVTVTINGFVVAGMQKIFDRSAGGTIALTQGRVPAMWWGAVGTGVDDKTAIQQAVDSMAARNGGVVFLDRPHYVTGPVQLKSGVTLESVSGLYHGGGQLLLLGQSSTSVISIGENTRRVGLRGLTLDGGTGTGNYGVAAAGTFPNSSFEVRITDCTFENFARCISVEGFDGVNNWECDHWQIDHCLFADSIVGIYTNTQNFDFADISGCRFALRVDVATTGIYLERAGFVCIRSCAFGSAGGELVHTAIVENIADTLLIQSVQCEQSLYQYHYIGPGDYNSPVTFVGCHIDLPIKIDGDINITFVGCIIFAPVTATSSGVRIYAIGTQLAPAQGGTPVGAWVLSGNSRVVVDTTGMHLADAYNVGVFSAPLMVSLASGAAADLGMRTARILVMNNGTGRSATFELAGGFGTVTKLDDPSGTFSTTPGAGSTNVYFNGGTATYNLQNVTGGPVVYRVISLGG